MIKRNDYNLKGDNFVKIKLFFALLKKGSTLREDPLQEGLGVQES